MDVNKSSSTVAGLLNLDEGVRYKIRVVAFNGSGEGPSSDAVYVVTGSAGELYTLYTCLAVMDKPRGGWSTYLYF